jgi:hypothetical protein
MGTPRPLTFSHSPTPTSCPPSQSHFGTHPSATTAKIAPFFSCTYGSPFCNPLCFQIHPGMGGVYPPSRPSQTFQPSNLPTCNAFSTYPLFFHILPNSFALTKNSTLFFSSKSELFSENTRGWGVPSVSRSHGNREGAERRGTQISAWKHVTSLFLLCETANADSRTIQEPSS